MSSTSPSLIALAAALLVAGCRQDMHNQPRYKPLRASGQFVDQRASRPRVEGTVPRGLLDNPTSFNNGRDAAGQPLATYPATLALESAAARRQFIERGQERFGIACAPCHGHDGGGRGIIVARGFGPPPSFHETRLREAPPGYFVAVIAEGFGRMMSAADRVAPADRWAIAAYIRALQLSQHTAVSELPPSVRSDLVAHAGPQETPR
jgi:mono/diheme cytochrome c family protein